MKQIFTDVPANCKEITDRAPSYSTALRNGCSNCTRRIRSMCGCRISCWKALQSADPSVCY